MRHRWELKVARGPFSGMSRVSPVPPPRGLGGGRSGTLTSSSGGGGREAAACRLALGCCGTSIAPLPSAAQGLPRVPRWTKAEPHRGHQSPAGAPASGLGHSQRWDMAHAVPWCQQGQWDVAGAALVSLQAMERGCHQCQQVPRHHCRQCDADNAGFTESPGVNTVSGTRLTPASPGRLVPSLAVGCGRCSISRAPGAPRSREQEAAGSASRMLQPVLP